MVLPLFPGCLDGKQMYVHVLVAHSSDMADQIFSQNAY